MKLHHIILMMIALKQVGTSEATKPKDYREDRHLYEDYDDDDDYIDYDEFPVGYHNDSQEVGPDLDEFGSAIEPVIAEPWEFADDELWSDRFSDRLYQIWI